MSVVKSTSYAPDIYKALRGILIVHKPAGISSFELISELKEKISEQLNNYEPRPLEKRLVVDGGYADEKRIIEVPNLADHPLVVGPRYNPFEIRICDFPRHLSTKSSGVLPLLMGESIRYFYSKFKRAKLINVYHISGCFGYATDNMFSDGKIIDKATYEHLRAWKIDNILSKIMMTQRDRLFDSSTVALDSQEAYELAKAWPSLPPRMARWPVIYRLRCIHLDLPKFKLEVTVANENDEYLMHIIQDIGVAARSNAHTESIRRVKHGMFDISDSLTSSEWDLQSILKNLDIHADFKKVHSYLDQFKKPTRVDTEHEPSRMVERM